MGICDSSWSEIQYSCYKFFEEPTPITMNEAEIKCKQQGALLAMPKNKKIQSAIDLSILIYHLNIQISKIFYLNFIFKFLNFKVITSLGGAFWFGLRAFQPDQWKWVDETLLKDTKVI